MSTVLPASTDVVVIGGGFAGLATAWALAQRSPETTVVVLERESEIGMYASGRGAGLGRQLAEDDTTSALTVRGAALLREWFPATWRATGGILSFDDRGHAEAYAARAVRLGVTVAPLDHAGVLAHWPTLTDLPVAAALHIPGDGVIDVKALLAAFATGATIIRGAGVTGVTPSARGAVVTTAKGAIEARVVVDASGAWAGAVVGDPPLATYKRHLFVLDAEPVAGTPFLWHLGARELYVRGDATGTLASPCDAARIEPTDQQPDLVGESHLRTVLEMAAPDLADAAIVRRWACHRAYTPDRQMRLGRDDTRPWLVWAAGLGGHGATASPAVGEQVAHAVTAALGR